MVVLPGESFPSKHGTLTKCWFNVGQRLRRWPTLKQHWINVSFENYLVIGSVADINAVSLYSIGSCWPTLDRPTHAHFAVG